LACLYKTLTLMLFNLINLPNLMGARRSCGQYLLLLYHQATLFPLPQRGHGGLWRSACALSERTGAGGANLVIGVLINYKFN
jgi:hypothetical protein